MTISELHIKAIEITDIAFVKRFHGLHDEAKLLFAEALTYEKEAALAAQKMNVGEPTISVLFKSAASLAINCEEFREAEKLISSALCGDPPDEIAEELRNLQEELNFGRHLQLRGITLGSTELQLVVAGDAISYGMAKSEDIFGRIDIVEKITFRTFERKAGKKFRERGDVSKEVRMKFQPYLSVPRAASFALTIRLGGASGQLKIEGMDPSADIIDDILENIRLVNISDFDALKNNIEDEVYFKNFIGLAKELAPDGKDINLVGLTIIRNGAQKDVQFTKIRSEINTSSFEKPTKSQTNTPVQLTGRLSAADEDKSNIRLTLDTGGRYSVIVPEGLGDIVKKYWGADVKVTGYMLRKNVLNLSDIDPG